MYEFKSKVFIVWGGNKSLADKVATRLKDSKTDACVGGDINKSGSDFYIGPTVINQMKNSTDAVILATAENDAITGRYRFRENLMFELGYLLNRISHKRIYVFVIDAKRGSLPSDLHGGWTYEVPAHLSSEIDQSAWSARTFREKRSVPDFIAFELFADWPRWKGFLERQVMGLEAAQPDLFGRVLVNAFAPALYANDLEFYEKILNNINPLEIGQNKYVTVAKSILEYIKLVRLRKPSEFKPGEFIALKQRFSHITRYKDKFLASIAKNLLGLCMKNEASLDKEYLGGESHDRYINSSISCYRDAIDYFRTARIDNRTRHLWLAYALSNISIAYNAVKDTENAIRHMEESIDSRKFILSHISEDRQGIIYDSYVSEYYIHHIRLCMIKNLKDDLYTDIEKFITNKGERMNYVKELLKIQMNGANEYFKRNEKI